MKLVKLWGYCVFLIAVLCLAIGAGATVHCVKLGGADGCYASIQAAVDAATAGDTIKVSSGVYNEGLNITKSLTLLGDGYDETSIAYTNPEVKSGAAFSGACGGSKISGFRISSVNAHGVSISNPNPNTAVTISNCLIAWCGLNGIYAYRNNAIIINNIIAENSGSGLYGATGGNWAIYPLVYNNIFYKNLGCALKDDSWTNALEATLRNNCYYQNLGGGCEALGDSPIIVDPQFVNYPANLHLAPGSPCVDFGFSSLDFNDCDGTRSDMGVYGGKDAICGPGPMVTNLQLVPSTVVQGDRFKIQATAATR